MRSSALLVVQPSLHGSGFGNQVGMLLLHVALAALSGRSLVLPPFHQPLQHSCTRRDTAGVPADEVFNLTALAPLAHVVSRRQQQPLPDGGDGGDAARLTFAAAAVRTKPRPLRLAPAPLPPLLAAGRLLRKRTACEEGAGGRCDVRDVAYCHLPSCRVRTKRSCRRLTGGCTRTSQRLPNNYLFAHRLSPLLCGGEGSVAGRQNIDQGVGGGADRRRRRARAVAGELRPDRHARCRAARYDGLAHAGGARRAARRGRR